MFGRGAVPDPAGELTTLPEIPTRMMRGTPLFIFLPPRSLRVLDLSAYADLGCDTVTGPWFSGPRYMALDGPALQRFVAVLFWSRCILGGHCYDPACRYGQLDMTTGFCPCHKTLSHDSRRCRRVQMRVIRRRHRRRQLQQPLDQHHQQQQQQQQQQLTNSNY